VAVVFVSLRIVLLLAGREGQSETKLLVLLVLNTFMSIFNAMTLGQSLNLYKQFLLKTEVISTDSVILKF
jgi:hypothetical protein